MTEKDLFREIGNINEKYVQEAAEIKKAKILTPAFRRTLATAACLCLCVGVYFGTRGLRGDFAPKESAMDTGTTQSATTNQLEATADGVYMESADMEANAEDVGSFFEELLDGFGDKEESATSGTQNTVQDSASDSEDNFYTEDAIAEQLPSKEQEEVGTSAAVKKELEDYSNDYEELCNGEAFVVTHGVVSAGYDKWEAFVNGYERGENVSVDVIRFTVEGDAIIIRVWYENGVFHILEDSTRDAWGVSDYAEYTFEGMNVIKSSDGMVQVIFADAVIYDMESVNYEETPVYFLVEYRIKEMTRGSEE